MQTPSEEYQEIKVMRHALADYSKKLTVLINKCNEKPIAYPKITADYYKSQQATTQNILQQINAN
jgi:predicted DNA-binding protein YlxM (UPF0122 family)